MLKDWFIFRRLFCQCWQFRTNAVIWAAWNLNCADSETPPLPKTSHFIFHSADKFSNNDIILLVCSLVHPPVQSCNDQSPPTSYSKSMKWRNRHIRKCYPQRPEFVSAEILAVVLSFSDNVNRKPVTLAVLCPILHNHFNILPKITPDTNTVMQLPAVWTAFEVKACQQWNTRQER